MRALFSVLPKTPSRPVLRIVDTSLTFIEWNIPPFNNSAPDEAPHKLLLKVTNDSRYQIELPPNTTRLSLRTEPGELYMITITSINPDGAATSEPTTLFREPTG